MYTIGAEVTTKRANYYSPIEQDTEASQCKKKKRESVSTEKPRVTARILGRRYALTTTAYKYLEIGISVGPVSCVEIALGDNRGNQLILSISTWKALIQKREDIERRSSRSLQIRELSVEFCKMHDDNIIKLTALNKSLYFTSETLDTLFNLEHCINHMYGWLCENTHIVDSKFGKFVNILQQHDVVGACYEAKSLDLCHAAKAIRESDDFDSESLVDCELLACALKDIMYEVVK